MNNRDWLFHVARGNYEGVQLMLQSIDPEEIVVSCSPRHVQSLLEDLRSVALGMAIKLAAKANQERGMLSDEKVELTDAEIEEHWWGELDNRSLSSIRAVLAAYEAKQKGGSA